MIFIIFISGMVLSIIGIVLPIGIAAGGGGAPATSPAGGGGAIPPVGIGGVRSTGWS